MMQGNSITILFASHWRSASPSTGFIPVGATTDSYPMRENAKGPKQPESQLTITTIAASSTIAMHPFVAMSFGN
jgi:hypothetical protein